MRRHRYIYQKYETVLFALLTLACKEITKPSRPFLANLDPIKSRAQASKNQLSPPNQYLDSLENSIWSTSVCCLALSQPKPHYFSTFSMSSHRYAANIPTLQRHISLSAPQFDHKTIFLVESLSPLIIVQLQSHHLTKFSTPPSYPPSLRRPDISDCQTTSEDCAQYFCAAKYTTPTTLPEASETRRRPPISSPEIRSVYVPRRHSTPKHADKLGLHAPEGLELSLLLYPLRLPSL